MAAGGGGAWKVAYADFVTAMMAFFLVMWICGQDQQIRKAVSYYFNDPFNTSKIGMSKLPSRSGSVSDINSYGSVPDRESAALGQGRKSHTPPTDPSHATRLISKWIKESGKTQTFWEEQAREARKWALTSKEVEEKSLTPEQAAAWKLAKHLRNELTPELAGDAKGLQQELLQELMFQVNWVEIAEDLLSH